MGKRRQHTGTWQKRETLDELAARAERANRVSLSVDLKVLANCLALVRGRAMRCAETALDGGSSAVIGVVAGDGNSDVPKEIRAILEIARLADRLTQLLDGDE